MVHKPQLEKQLEKVTEDHRAIMEEAVTSAINDFLAQRSTPSRASPSSPVLRTKSDAKGAFTMFFVERERTLYYKVHDGEGVLPERTPVTPAEAARLYVASFMTYPA